VPVFGSATVELKANTAAKRVCDNGILYTFDVGADFEIVTADADAPRNSTFECSGGGEPIVSTPIMDPPGGTYSEPINVTISTTTDGATIRYTLNGSEPDESSTLFSTPIPVSEQTTIRARAWKVGYKESAIRTVTYSFPKTVTTLAALRELAPPYTNGNSVGTEVFIYKGRAVVTQTIDYDNVKYIQDATGAMMIFDRAKKINGIQNEDQISNIVCTLTDYFGMVQIIPLENCEQADWNKKVEPIVITLSQLDFNHANPIQSKLIKVEQVQFTQTGNFEAGVGTVDRYYNLKQNDVTYDSVIFIHNREADYIGKPIPTTLINIHGVINFKGHTAFPTKNRIVMLDNKNLVWQVGINEINPSVIKLSPNPATNFVNVVVGAPMKLEIYGIMGNLMATEILKEGSNIISVSNYASGVYIMKTIDNSTKQVFTQKLIVQ
jgi:hypothetical protein